MKQIHCPKCKSYKIMRAREKDAKRCLLIIFFSLFLFPLFPVAGLFFFFVPTIVFFLMIIFLIWGALGYRECKKCNYKWNINETKRTKSRDAVLFTSLISWRKLLLKYKKIKTKEIFKKCYDSNNYRRRIVLSFSLIFFLMLYFLVELNFVISLTVVALFVFLIYWEELSLNNRKNKWIKLFKENMATEKRKSILIGVCIIFVATILGMGIYGGRAPTITITKPSGDVFVASKETVIEGMVAPRKAKLKVNNKLIKSHSDGTFIYAVALKEGANNFSFVVTSNRKSSKASVTIKRILTIKEKREKQALEEYRKKTTEEAKVKKLAEQREWEQSKAGRVCVTHPEWSREDCKKIANNKIWIGMSLDMLKYNMGAPDVANSSNYGSGIEWQWCWDNWNPSCFYGDNDGIIDAYN